MSNNIISSLGAGSGIDVAGLVSQLSAVERAPQQERIDTTKLKLEAQISAYGKLKSALDGFSSSISALGSQDLFNARSVAVPTSTLVTADKVSPGAQTGTYQIKVESLAAAQSLAIGGQTDRATALGKSGQMTIDFGAWTDNAGTPEFAPNSDRKSASITVEATDSLDTLAQKINDTKSGVQASVLKVDGQFQLMLTAPSGESNAMRISTDGTLGDFAYDGANTATVTQTQAASDAKLQVNGLTVYRQSNSIDDVIEGFAFTLNKADPSETLTFSVTEDKSAAQQAVRDFVTAYNDFQKTTQELVGYTRDEKDQVVRGDLAGDSSARTMISRLRSMISDAVPGVSSGFTALTNIGIRTAKDGSLSVSEEEFSAAFSSQFDLVKNLFASGVTSSSSAIKAEMGSFASKTVPGTYGIEISQAPTQGRSTNGPLTYDFGVNGPLDTSGGGYSFEVKVDGISSNPIELDRSYDSTQQLVEDLETRINNDANLKEKGVKVSVMLDTDTNALTFISREYGSSSGVEFSAVSPNLAAAGVGFDSLTATRGKDVAGSIDGIAGFGAGNVLLPALDSKAYGLNLTVADNAPTGQRFEIGFARGFAGELTNLINDFLGNSGALKMRQDNLQSQLRKLDDDQDRLDMRMEKFSTRLQVQFMAMEGIVNSLSSTGSQLDGLADRLPFTAPR